MPTLISRRVVWLDSVQLTTRSVMKALFGMMTSL